MNKLITENNLRWERLSLGIIVIGMILGTGCSVQNPLQNNVATKSTFTSDQVTHFSDGDSMTLRDLGRVRLVGVDCPELHQKGGREAAAFAKRKLQHQNLEIEVCKEDPKDQYGRSLVFLYYNDHAGKRQLFNRQLLSQGFARVYKNTPCLNGRRDQWEADGEVPDGKKYRRKHPR